MAAEGLRLLVIGGGWAGLAAAVRATQRGALVTLWDMAPQLGGRARSSRTPAVPTCTDNDGFDSGQHILLGAYRDTLALMTAVGAAPETHLQRLPLTLVNAQGQGLRWPAGLPPWLGVANAVWRHPRWRMRDRWSLLVWGLRWLAGPGRCPPQLSVQDLVRGLTPAVREDLIEPLCIAALNTPPATASAAVLLRVLRDTLFSGPGGADLLLPKVPLSALLPEPAQHWLQAQGAGLHTTCRARALRPAPAGPGWCAEAWDGRRWQGDTIVVAASATEAARLVDAHAPGWAQQARALTAEAIATLYLRGHGVRLPAPMVTLAGGPAQFVFDLGQLGGPAGRFAVVASAVAGELDTGLEALGARMQAQAGQQIPGLKSALREHVHADRRATFACTPGLQRPALHIAPGLCAAGDYIEGPYPATLEGAVRSGWRAADRLLDPHD